jgi:hypothetical protein
MEIFRLLMVLSCSGGMDVLNKIGISFSGFAGQTKERT